MLDLDNLKREFKIEGEIKWRYFYNSNASAKITSLSHLTILELEEVRTKIFSIISKCESIKTICIIADAAKAYKLSHVNTPDELYCCAYKKLTERFQYYLQDISRISGQKINGIVICDHRTSNQDKILQGIHGELMRGNSKVVYNNLIEGLFLAPSHFSIGIQLADLVAGAVLRKTKNNDDRFFNQISNTFRRSESGKIRGYGLVYFPNNTKE